MDGDTGHGGIMVVRRMVRDTRARIDDQPEQAARSAQTACLSGKEQEEPLSAR
jgi:hypothetical protein